MTSHTEQKNSGKVRLGALINQSMVPVLALSVPVCLFVIGHRGIEALQNSYNLKNEFLSVILPFFFFTATWTLTCNLKFPRMNRILYIFSASFLPFITWAIVYTCLPLDSQNSNANPLVGLTFGLGIYVVLIPYFLPFLILAWFIDRIGKAKALW